MSLIASTSSTTNYEPIPAGSHVARCVSIVDLGTQTTEYQGETKENHKVRITFETPLETKVFKEENGEQPHLISREFTVSFHPKASLRQFVESWFGKKMTKEEETGFNLLELLGKEALINVVHNESNGKTYANIAGVSPLAKGMTCPEQVNQSIVFDIDSWDQAVYDNMPEWLQDKIMASPEAQARFDGFAQAEEELV